MMRIELPEMSGLTFDPRGHIYRLNGIALPSVTTLMKPLSNEVYQTVDPKILEKAANRGTAVHYAAENYVLFGIEDIPPAFAEYFHAFLAWWDTRKPEALATEYRIYHKILRYAGTADLICLINGKLTLVDYKTSAQVNSRLCAVQLEAYDRALEIHGIKIEERLILHLSKTGYQEIPFQRSSKCWSILSDLLEIWRYMNE